MINGQNLNKTIFALDIGTRTVIGLVGHMEGNNFKILAQEILEHDSRSMIDGQIHDIPQVAAVVAQVKARLEQKTGLALNQVAVAAAGRSLKTVRCQATMALDKNKEIETIDIRSLELIALQQAQQKLEQQDDAARDYYCVGHCPIAYTVGDMPVLNPLGHRASEMGVEAVATFLPVSVVNSLYAVLGRVHLEPTHLTLEPIAAIDAAIPTSFRMLNLALVDIGAGTADIAISQAGSIIAYGMVPLAGDEITEPLMEKLLVEFSEAEKIKRSLGDKKSITYTDIMGITHQINRDQVLEIIEPVVDKLAHAIGQAIVELNGGLPPKSVFGIGGGAQTTGLMEKLAQYLQIEPERVAVRDRTYLRHLVPTEHDMLAGPEGVTVIGIATVALNRLGYEFITFKVNRLEHSVFNTNDLNVAQVLGYIQFDPRELIGRNGRDLKFTLNGTAHTVFGQLGQSAQILVNGKTASLQTPVRANDDIQVLNAIHGLDATAVVKDFAPNHKQIALKINGKTRHWPIQVRLNGEPTADTAAVQPGDKLEIIDSPTVAAVLDCFNLPHPQQPYINNKPATLQDRVTHGDNIATEPGAVDTPANTNIAGAVTDTATARPKPGLVVTINGKQVSLPAHAAIFVDIFNEIDIDTTNTTGTLIMKLNGQPAQYTDPITAGDEIDIYWLK